MSKRDRLSRLEAVTKTSQERERPRSWKEFVEMALAGEDVPGWEEYVRKVREESSREPKKES